MLKLTNPNNIKHCILDKFIIYNSETNILVQYDFSVSQNEHNIKILNDHEKRNGRNGVYKSCRIENCEIENYIKRNH